MCEYRVLASADKEQSQEKENCGCGDGSCVCEETRVLKEIIITTINGGGNSIPPDVPIFYQ